MQGYNLIVVFNENEDKVLMCRRRGNAFKVAQELNCKKISIGIVEENKVLREWYEAFGFIHMST